MATAPVTLSAARKLVERHGVLWTDGPVCGRDEIKAWEIELADLLELVEAVERAAPSTKVAAQWLRRMFYSKPLGGAGSNFDGLISTDPSRAASPMTTLDIPQSVLDALVRIGSVRIPRGATFERVEISHAFVLVDLKLNGLSAKGQKYILGSRAMSLFLGIELPTPADMLSYAGDLGSAWVGYQERRDAAKRAAGTTWSEPVASPADLARPLAWLEVGVRGRSGIEDLLGDMDAVVMADLPLPASPTPIATVLRNYYTVGIPSSGGAVRVDDRFSQWVRRTRRAIPFKDSGAGTELTPEALPWAEQQIRHAVLVLLTLHRGKSDAQQMLAAAPGVLAELSGPWHSAMIKALAGRFISFLEDGLAGRAPTWSEGVSIPVPYPGYDWSPSPPAAAAVPALDDLEAIAQFHLNWQQPHRALRAHPLFQPLRLRDPEGAAASAVPGGAAGTARIQLDGFATLKDVLPSATSEHADLLRLDGDSARPSKTYRITAIDRATRTVTLEGVPILAAPSAWRVLRRPRLLLIDPFGARMAGTAASMVNAPPGWIWLDGAPDFARLRANFDVLLLQADGVRTSRAYRIVEVHPTEARVRLDATPLFMTASSWQIPCGVAQVVNPLAFALVPLAEGCDAYDGVLFVIHQDAVVGQPVPFSSYTSAANSSDPVIGSSITGNARYTVISKRSPVSPARNYQFAVTDPDEVAADTVVKAAFYGRGVTALRQTPLATDAAPEDPDGKTAIRIHIGNSTGSVSGSAGDLVAPDYPALRTLLISLHQNERALLGLPADQALAKVGAARTQDLSKALYNGGEVGDQEWNDKLHAELILVRPDLRPTSPP